MQKTWGCRVRIDFCQECVGHGCTWTCSCLFVCNIFHSLQAAIFGLENRYHKVPSYREDDAKWFWCQVKIKWTHTKFVFSFIFNEKSRNEWCFITNFSFFYLTLLYTSNIVTTFFFLCLIAGLQTLAVNVTLVATNAADF